jgi:hypothetical protein
MTPDSFLPCPHILFTWASALLLPNRQGKVPALTSLLAEYAANRDPVKDGDEGGTGGGKETRKAPPPMSNLRAGRVTARKAFPLAV